MCVCVCICVCVCVCVCERERERKRERERERERDPAIPHTIIKLWHLSNSCKSSKALILNDKFLDILK